MSEIESDQFNKMYRQHGEMFDMITEMKEVLVGNPTYRRLGIIDEIKELKQVQRDHDLEDEKKFDEIFEFQNKQKYLVGWSGILVRALGGAVVILIGWLISVFFR